MYLTSLLYLKQNNGEARLMSYTLEIVSYQLKSTSSIDNFIHKSQLVDNELKKFNGFLSRELGRSDDKNWIEICKWKSLTEAKEAQSLVMNNTVCLHFFSELDQSSIKMTYYRVIKK